MPEVGGRVVDRHAEDHEQTMLALGLSSKREITRTRIPGADRDGRPDQGAGPVPRRTAAVRVPARRRGSESHLTYMTPIALTTEFVLDGGAR